MDIYFSILIDNGKVYSKEEPGIAICDYADLLAWNEERNEEFWDKVYTHYQTNIKFTFPYELTSTSKIEDIKRLIVNHIGFDWELFSESYVSTHILVNNEFVEIENSDMHLSKITKYYDINDVMYIFFLFSNQAGDIWVEDGLRYYMHSKEAGSHNNPHIHVDYRHETSASICIFDGSVLDGTLPSKALKRAKRKILKNKKNLLECWNKKTDGLKVDINHYFGIIPLNI